MKKIFYSLFVFLFTLPNLAFALEKEVNQTKGFLELLGSFFTAEMLLRVIFAVITIFLTFLVSKIIKHKLFNYLGGKFSNGDDNGNKEEIVSVISRSVNVTVLIVGFTLTLSVLGIDLGILMGGIGFGLGFTLKSFLTNFVGGIMMVTQGFYHMGDLININGNTGRIIKIHSLFTSIKGFDGVTYYIPNVMFMEQEVANYSTGTKRRVNVNVGIDYTTDVTKTKKILSQVVGSFPNVLKEPEPVVLVDELGNNSINLNLRFWISSEDNYFEAKSNVTETINLAFKQAGIHIPFNQITISNRPELRSK